MEQAKPIVRSDGNADLSDEAVVDVGRNHASKADAESAAGAVEIADLFFIRWVACLFECVFMRVGRGVFGVDRTGINAIIKREC